MEESNRVWSSQKSPSWENCHHLISWHKTHLQGLFLFDQNQHSLSEKSPTLRELNNSNNNQTHTHIQHTHQKQTQMFNTAAAWGSNTHRSKKEAGKKQKGISGEWKTHKGFENLQHEACIQVCVYAPGSPKKAPVSYIWLTHRLRRSRERSLRWRC